MKNHLHLLLAFVFITHFVKAQTAGQLDNSFNSIGFTTYDYGFQDNLTDVTIQPTDQKILSCGTALTQAFAGQLLVQRHNTNGQPDLTFNNTGYLLVDKYNESYAYSVKVRTDGTILVAGATTDSTYIFSGVVMRLKANGTPDSTFGTNGFATVKVSNGDNFVYSMAELANHQILVAGTALDTGFRNQPVVIRLNENGSIDSTFGVNGVAAVPVTETDNRFNKIALQADGKIVAAGHYGNPVTNDGQVDFDILIARFTTNGTADSTLSNDGVLTDKVSVKYVDDIFGLGITSTGKIAVAGYTTLPDFSYDVILLQYDSTGARDLTFGTAGLVQFDSAVQDVANALTVLPDDKLLVAGTTGGFFFDNRDLLLMRYNTNGVIDSAFGGIGYVTTDVLSFMDEANAVTLQADGKIVVAGKANNSNQNDVLLARYFNSNQPNAISNITTALSNVYPNPVANNSTVNISSTQAINRLQLCDVTGRTLATEQYAPQTLSTVFALPEGLSNGVYLLTINNNTYKLVVR